MVYNWAIAFIFAQANFNVFIKGIRKTSVYADSYLRLLYCAEDVWFMIVDCAINLGSTSFLSPTGEG